MKFKQQYAKLTDRQKLTFLDAIISENRDLQETFLRYFEAEKQDSETLSLDKFLKIISGTAKKYKAVFEDVDLENPDWDHYTPSNRGYMKSWEQAIEASEQELERIFDQFRNMAGDLLISHRIADLTAMLIGLYLAAEQAKVYDPWNTFDTVNDHLKEEHHTTTTFITEQIKKTAITNHTIINATSLFFQYYSEPDTKDKPYVAVFEDYLMTLAGKSTQPEQVLAQLDKSVFERREMPRLMLYLSGKTGKPSDWLELAKTYYQENDEIALQLLEHYVENSPNEFLVLAKELFRKAPGYWAPLLSELVTPDINSHLFAKVHVRLVQDQYQFPHYMKARPYLSLADKNRLLKKIDWNKSLMVQILAVEERYEEIRQIVEVSDDNWQYSELIKPILHVYPKFCYQHISATVLKTIANQRGRSVYQRIVEWLQLAYTIEGFRPQSEKLTNELYHHKPSLPALKDELRKGGLV
jgi:hypothetical protein